MSLNIKKYSFVFRIIVGIVFIISAIMKLNTIDSFEVYIYSLNIVDLNTSFLLARLIISLELFLGVLLIFKLYLQKVIISTAIVLSLFILYIIYLILTGDKEHCHCFGDSLKISHSLSILKNILLIILLILSYPKNFIKHKHSLLIIISIFIISIITPLIISPPDSFRIEEYSSKATYNQEFLSKFLKSNNLEQGKHIICFFATKCRFCKLSAKKMDVIWKRSANKTIFSNVFWGDEESIIKFHTETSTREMPYKSISGNEFLKITNGKMPLIILIQDGKLVKKYGYRSIIDNEIIDFAK